MRFYVFASFAVAASLAASSLAAEPGNARQLGLLGILAALGLAQAEAGRSVERMRRRMAGVAHIDMTSVWTFAAVLLLPLGLTAFLVIVLYTHLWVRCWFRLNRVPLWRAFNNTCSVILTCAAGKAVEASTPNGLLDGRLGSPSTLLATIAVYFTVGAVVVVPARDVIVWSWRGLFGDVPENVLELATLCLGLLTAMTLLVAPALVVLVLPPLVMMHRSVLLRQLEAEASTDPKTDVLNSAGWHQQAARVLARAGADEAPLALLMIDVDRFKRVNDSHGHLAGDDVLREIAKTITRHVRDRDVVGRFGGEEFVVLLPDVSPADSAAVAERIRAAVEQMRVPIMSDGEPVVLDGLTVSIGLATHPSDARDLQWLLDVADRAVYTAKHSGRNRVVHGDPA